MTNFTALDNPIWNSLATDHAAMARVSGLARQYPSDVSPLTGVREPTAAALADLAKLVRPEDGVALFTPEPIDLPDNWKVVRTLDLEQWVCTENPEPTSIAPQRLTHADVPEMLALTAATEPGPFRPRTIDMGDYFGIRSEEGRLVAMAGERLNLTQFTEVSAVCTDPAFRGRGYAQGLVSFVAQRILSRGKTPFLHVVPHNPAKKVYAKVGFRCRRIFNLTIVALK